MADATTLVAEPGGRTIVVVRTFGAPREAVFEAWTKPEHVSRWLGRRGDVMTVCEVDLRVGGRWRYVWQLLEGGVMGMGGEYLEVEPPARLVSSEVFEGEDFEVMGGGTVNTVVFEDVEGGTRVTVTSEYESTEARDGALATGMEGGMNEGFERLAELLANLTTRKEA